MTQNHHPKAPENSFLSWMKHLTGVGLVFTGMLLGGFIVTLLVAGEVYENTDTFDGASIPEVDAIVCLAGAKGRIMAAGDLWARYHEQRPKKVPILYISGMGKYSNFSVFARQLRSGVKDIIQPDRVYLETESSNTWSNAEVFYRVAKEKNWNSILLITSNYHMRRAKMIFEKVGQERNQNIQIETYSIFQESLNSDEWRTSLQGIRVTLTEYFKFFFYRYL